jgi:hypothetical protein
VGVLKIEESESEVLCTDSTALILSTGDTLDVFDTAALVTE